MKILHISDTHLGFSAYRKATPDGINQREMDVYKAFEEFIDYAVKSKPDLIIHAGDLFDSVRPNNRAITFAINQIFRLTKEKIPIVNPPGTGNPILVISERFAPLPPRISFISLFPSLKLYTYFFSAILSNTRI